MIRQAHSFYIRKYSQEIGAVPLQNYAMSFAKEHQRRKKRKKELMRTCRCYIYRWECISWCTLESPICMYIFNSIT